MRRFSWVMLLLGSCGDDVRRFEVVAAARPLGIESPQPVIAAPGSYTLSFVAVMPRGTELSGLRAAALSQARAPGETELTAEVDWDNRQQSDYATLSLVRVPFRVTVPDQIASVAPPWRLVYQLVMESAGDAQKVRGMLRYVSADDPLLALPPPEAEFLPALGAGGTSPRSVRLAAAAKAGAESDRLKLQWWVAGGKISNGAAQETDWLEAPAGTQTVLLTVRSRLSRHLVVLAQDLEL